MLVEIHMLKNYAPTNLNRDETGTPKTCTFGGVTRSRISSQCLKRSWRKSTIMGEGLTEEVLGIRTRKLPKIVAERLLEKGISEDYTEEIKTKLSGFGNKEGKANKDSNITSQIIFYSHSDIEAVCELLQKEIEKCSDVKEFVKIKAKDLQDTIKKVTRPISLDMALFGRMVTSDAFANVEASIQVAHAFSINKVYMDTDFFVAMDDMVTNESNDDLGASMMGYTDYNSSCYYIYACLDTDKLMDNLKNSPECQKYADDIIARLVETMAFTNPDGKQNSFAGHSLPCAILVECKDKKVPVSYANAFVKPVSPGREGDFVEKGITQFTEEVRAIAADYQLPVIKRLWYCSSKYKIKLEDIATNCPDFTSMLKELPSIGI
ncbi:MAG: type I-E CRISPR-associated protein Cas7/Cse4/CasC [Eubacteriaceae bacterium]|nr:type I-E CRISPR-associated protein Cas7/Cse4/CasC [Eubacteriaceae bacterium]